jgi:UDP-glucuronate decarboxylase
MSSDFYLESDIEEIAGFMGEEVHAIAGKTLLMSGGCGFLGRYFTRLILYLNENVLAKPCRLIVLDNFITSDARAASEHNAESYTFIEHDIVTPIVVDEPVDYIIHAAGIASPYYYRKYPLKTLEVATTGTKNLLELAKDKKVQSFLFFSSSEIYGNPDAVHVPTPESYRGYVSSLGPRACYDESKRLGETLSRIYHEEYGVPTKIVRPFNAYGPGMQQFDYRVLPNFADRIVNGKPLQIYGDGSQTRTFCYITDGINGFFRTLLMGSPGEAYNVGNGSPEVSMLVLAKTLEEALERKLDIVTLEYPDAYPPDEPMRRCPDLTKSRVQLSYTPQVGLVDGLRRYFNWALASYTKTD